MPEKNIEQLFDKYRDGTCSEEEKALVEAWYLHYVDSESLDLSAEDRTADLEELRASLPMLEQNRSKTLRLWPRIAAAVSIIFVLSIGAWSVWRQDGEKPQIANNSKKDLVKPGGNKASLTLADGSIIILNEAVNGKIAQQAGIAITKTSDGQLIYTVNKVDPANEQPIGFNTIVTPRGGQYQVNLPDGTKVWLNAESSLKYPTIFNGIERKVELIGEAYFEVAHNKMMPFRVQSNNQVVEVIGTHFNINSYVDEPTIKTTLLEGAVMVKSRSQQTILKPGQQAIFHNLDQTLIAVPANLEGAVAWKNGYFMFSNENLQSIMRKIARWYDVDVEYRGKIANKTFGGTISKFENVAEILKMIELTGVIHFTMEGRRIIVTP